MFEDYDQFTEELLEPFALSQPAEVTVPNQTVCSADRALIACKNHCGRVDMRYMSALSGLSIPGLILALRGRAIVQDPAQFENAFAWDLENGWIFLQEYCTGYLPEKLALARRMNVRFPDCFSENIRVLEKIMPAMQDLADVRVSLGATWVPAWIYADFIRTLLDFRGEVTVRYRRELAAWEVNAPEEAKHSVRNHTTYGTADISAVRIIEQTMNARIPKVYDFKPRKSGKVDRILNRDATLAVQEKQQAILEEFNRWVYADPERKSLLEDCYNDTMVGYTFYPVDGSFLELPGLNPAVNFYPSQRNAIARILLTRNNLLLAHDVGTGKTYIMITALHELKRMGLSEKNLMVVPNNVLQATVDTHRYLYPDDKILVVYPKDFTPQHRHRVLKQIKEGDYVAIYMAYSSFDMVDMSKEYWVNKMTESIRELRRAATNCTHKREKKALEAQAERESRKLSKFIVEKEEDPWPPFDSLGINTLIVDEAHNYKNISLNTKTDNIVGMHAQGSKKCIEMFEKCHYADRIIFATGTPLTNSLADLFVMQSYLQQEDLKFHGIDTFDMWINCFAQRQTTFEVDIDSRGLRSMTRFSTFHNLTELMSLFSTVCDFHHLEGTEAGLPAFRGYTDICVPKNEAQHFYLPLLSKRTDLVRAHKVPATEDNLLKITTDGRKCALDARLVEIKDYNGGFENTKLDACAAKILQLYHSYPNTCQAVFSDIGTPKATFNVYDCLCEKLVAQGIPREEVAFVHDATTEATRTRLFSAINAGLIRVIIGSTSKLGVGVNVQERLIALHHLSVPWRPADMVQREGRIIRNGNTCEEVFIFRYITEGSFDSYSWQLLENKQRFISSFLSGSSSVRETEDIADAVLSYAEVKALAIGNPLIKTRVETANRLERAKLASRQRQKEMLRLKSAIESTPATLKQLDKQIAIATADRTYYILHKKTVPNADRIAFGEELLEALQDNQMMAEIRLFDTYQGFDVLLPANMITEKPYIYLHSPNGGHYHLEMDAEKPIGCSRRIDYYLEHFTERINHLKDQQEEARKRRREAEADLDTGNPHLQAVERLTAELADIDSRITECA